MSNTPVKTYARKGLKVAIWENEHETDNGIVTRHSVSINKRYHDAKNGEWKDSNSFFPDDLLQLRELLRKADDFIAFSESEPLPSDV